MKLWLQISTVLLSVLTAWGDRNSEKLLKLAGFSSSQSRNLEINGFGTGFAVSPDGYLISASHVTEGCDAVRVLFKKGEFLDARVVREEPQLDLVFLKVDIPTPSYLSVTNRTSSLGDDIYTIGYPTPEIMGFNQKFTKGSISALTGIYDSSFRYQISVPIQPGNSGGPVICEETGEVIGIVVSFLNDKAVEFIPQNVNYALKSGFIKPIMESLEIKNNQAGEISHNRKARREKVVDATCMIITCKFTGLNLDQKQEEKNSPIDTSPPVLTLLGEDPMYIKFGDDYIEPGVKSDGDETVFSEGNVNSGKSGSYKLKYWARDEAGNVGNISRVVIVEDAEDRIPPSIYLVGKNPMTINVGEKYEEPGAFADGGEKVFVQGEVNINTPGSYKLKYSAKDPSGNIGQSERIVIVEAVTPKANQDDVGLRIVFNGNNGGSTIGYAIGSIGGSYKLDVYLDGEYLGTVSAGQEIGYFKFKGSGTRNLKVINNSTNLFGKTNKQVFNSNINLSPGLNTIAVRSWR